MSIGQTNCLPLARIESSFLGRCENIIFSPKNGRITIRWEDPDDFPIGSYTVEWRETRLVRKIGGYPSNPEDGTLVLSESGTRNQYLTTPYVDENLVNGTVYYYCLFPISKEGNTSFFEENCFKVTPRPTKTYGVKIHLSNPDPFSSVSYIADAIGKTPGDSWENEPIFKDIKPCVFKHERVNYYLKKDDFTRKEDGALADTVSGEDGDVMIEIPKMGIKMETSGSYLSIYITDERDAPGFSYLAHSRKTPGDKNVIYVGTYLGKVRKGILRSLSGVTPDIIFLPRESRPTVQKKGEGYGFLNFYVMTLIQCLFILKYKNLDSQKVLGTGYFVGTYASVQITGETDLIGMNGQNGKRVKFLGLEDSWGHLGVFIDGVVYRQGAVYANYRNFNDEGNGYPKVGNVHGSINFLKEVQGTSLGGFLPKVGGGSQSTYFCDYVGYWGNNNLFVCHGVEMSQPNSSLGGLFGFIPTDTLFLKGVRLLYC